MKAYLPRDFTFPRGDYTLPCGASLRVSDDEGIVVVVRDLLESRVVVAVSRTDALRDPKVLDALRGFDVAAGS